MNLEQDGNMRRDKSPLTDEELYPYKCRIEELINLHHNDEISYKEYEYKRELYQDTFPWIELETELCAWNAHTFWRDSLGNGGYWITRPRMSEERLKELKDKGIDIYND